MNRVLLIDNYDSFTYNLFDLITRVTGVEPIVVPNDRVSWNDLIGFDMGACVLSPGPGRPERRSDFGICSELIQHGTAPLLGVCLGHEGICHVFGGRIMHAPEPVHGRASRVFHDGRDLFRDVPQGFQAIRYHSLVVAEPLPAALETAAWSSDGVIMSVRHRTRPIWGVQFHPESIGTEFGEQIIANFIRLAEDYAKIDGQRDASSFNGLCPGLPSERRQVRSGVHTASRRVFVRKVDCTIDIAAVFDTLSANAKYAFWLDSGLIEAGFSRFSFFGAVTAKDSERVEYQVAQNQVKIREENRETILHTNIFEYLNEQLALRYAPPADVPFEFNCGYVGYLGYELRHLCGSPIHLYSDLPDAVFLFVDRLIAFDHIDGRLYLLYCGSPADAARAEQWFDSVLAQIAISRREAVTGNFVNRPAMTFFKPRETYLRDIESCQNHIGEGETYEICLTNEYRGSAQIDPLRYYHRLRSQNSAPYGAFLRLDGVDVACTSPERFLKVGVDRRVESHPIKGTLRRGLSAEEDELLRVELRSGRKTMAENLMVVDLVRHDLGRVCVPGSVTVPSFMDVRTYATVHQLVSVVAGRLRDGVTAVDCVRSAFPPGSMTGAPKIRTMQILDSLEGRPRKIYSGAIGYFGLCGSADFNVVIRTAVFHGNSVSIGVGGAVTALSQPEAEWDEAVLKGRALLEAFGV